jgi:hypothetical protein
MNPGVVAVGEAFYQPFNLNHYWLLLRLEKYGDPNNRLFKGVTIFYDYL